MPEMDPRYHHNKVLTDSEKNPIPPEVLIASLTDANHACVARTTLLIEMLGQCRQQFALYAENHRAKGTEDGDQKAKVNQALAEQIDSVLHQFRQRDEKPEEA